MTTRQLYHNAKFPARQQYALSAEDNRTKLWQGLQQFASRSVYAGAQAKALSFHLKVMDGSYMGSSRITRLISYLYHHLSLG